MAKLDGLRKQIDAIDEQILTMLEKRAAVVEQVAEANEKQALLRTTIPSASERSSIDSKPRALGNFRVEPFARCSARS